MSANQADSDREKQRVTELELSLMHLQKDYESLNEVVLENAKRLDSMSKTIQQLTDRLSAAEDPEPVRNAEDEKPPHY